MTRKDYQAIADAILEARRINAATRTTTQAAALGALALTPTTEHGQ